MILWIIALLFSGTVAAQIQSGGPAVLSRGRVASPGSNPRLLTLRPYVQAAGVYQSDISPPVLSSSGALPKVDSYGGRLSAGISGNYTWQRSLLAVDYFASASHYARAGYVDSIDQNLSLGYTTQLSAKTNLSLIQSAGMYTRRGSLGNPNGLGPRLVDLQITDPGAVVLPAADLLDTRTQFLASSADLSHALSRRLSFNVGGTGFLVLRRAAGFADVHGYGARGDVSYRLSRRQTVGAEYQLLRFNFNRAFGFSEVHMTGVTYSAELGRIWTFSSRFGIARVEHERIIRVTLDPVVGAVLGTRFSNEVSSGTNYSPVMQAGLTAGFRRSSFLGGFSRLIVPGNGVYLTSLADTIQTGYSYTGLSRVGLGISAQYIRLSAVTQAIPPYESYAGSARASYRLLSYLHLSCAYGIQRTEVQHGGFRRTSNAVTLGLIFAPGEFPVSF